jgi:hypothetical protein
MAHSHRIAGVLTSFHHQSRPFIDKLKESLIDEEQIQQVLKQYWTPTERIQSSAERIFTSTSTLTPTPTPTSTSTQTRPITPPTTLPSPPEEEAVESLSTEIGTDVRDLLRRVAVMFEMLPEKVNELSSLEKELKDADAVIERYQTMMEKFTKEVDEFSRLVPLGVVPPSDSFLNVLNENVNRYLMEYEIPSKLKRYQFLLSQIAMIRAFIELIHQRVTVTSPEQDGERLPVCKVCLDAKADFIMIPCGHLCCEVCMNRMNSENTRCYFCRRNVVDITKVYY